MSTVICFYGGPGTGKSTTAAWFFALLKSAGYNAELVQEYVKQWAWEDRKPVTLDQFYFFGKQSRKEYSLFKNVDVIVTDSPASLVAYYAKIFGTPEQAEVFSQMTKLYYKMAADYGHTHIHIWLKRVKPYNPKGRFQNEEEAKAIDADMKIMVKNDLGITLHEFEGSEEGVHKILEFIKPYLEKPI